MGAFLNGEWESLYDIFKFEAPNFGAQIIGHPTNNDFSFDDTCSLFDNNNNECFLYDPTSILNPSSTNDIFSDNASDKTSYNISSSNIPNSYENCHFSLSNDVIVPMNSNIKSMMDQENHACVASALRATPNLDGPNSSQVGSVEDNESEKLGSPPVNLEVQVKRKCNAPELETEHKVNTVLKKKARLSKDRGKNSIIESKTIVQENVGEKGNSDDESKFSEQTSEVNIPTSNKELISETLKTKKRASRGTATDPQSIYARRRRERINERLRILQNLVPNGTKVDISTMLEEAVHYVKFLQLQIQLLSSDDLWMYAPIAYNGIDINLYKRISPFLLP